MKVAEMLKGECAKFVSGLIDKVSTDANPAHSNDVLSLFKRIHDKEGGVVFQREVLAGGKPAAGTISGSIGNIAKPATIYIRYDVIVAGHLAPENNSAAQRTYALTAIHETMHLAGKNGAYSDEALVWAAHALVPGSPPLPPNGSNATTWSTYWDDILMAKCP